MRQIYNTRELEIPEDVEVDIKSKVVTVKGPRGKLFRRPSFFSFFHTHTHTLVSLPKENSAVLLRKQHPGFCSELS